MPAGVVSPRAAGLTEAPTCACGCGHAVRLPSHRFIHNHNARLTGPRSPHWKGGRRTGATGYVYVRQPTKRYVEEHVAIVERVLGKLLPPTAEVHHVDGDRDKNANRNLVVCQDHKYHMLLEVRTRAFRACGHADWRRCYICKKWDCPENLKLVARKSRERQGRTPDAYHSICQRRRLMARKVV